MTDLSKELRDYASDNGYSHSDYADVITQAANEIDTLRARVKELEEKLKVAEEELGVIRGSIVYAALAKIKEAS